MRCLVLGVRQRLIVRMMANAARNGTLRIVLVGLRISEQRLNAVADDIRNENRRPGRSHPLQVP